MNGKSTFLSWLETSIPVGWNAARRALFFVAVLMLTAGSAYAQFDTCWSPYCDVWPGDMPSAVTVKSESCQFDPNVGYWFWGGYEDIPCCHSNLPIIPMGEEATLQYRHMDLEGDLTYCYDHIDFWYRIVGDTSGWHYLATRHPSEALYSVGYLTLYEFEFSSSIIEPGDSVILGANYFLPQWAPCAPKLVTYRMIVESPMIYAAGGTGGIFRSSDIGETWERKESNSSAALNSVCFINSSTGWVAGGQAILKTTDSGNTWTDKYESGAVLNSVHFSDGRHGWAVGSTGRIVYSFNWGETWIPQESNSSADLQAVFFINEKTGWAAGGQVILKTTDGGQTWVDKYDGGDMFNSVYFINAENGWAVGSTGHMAYSTDGGETWTEEESGSSADLQSVYFADDTLGWIAGGQVIFKTADGGLTWNNKYDSGGAMSSVIFLSDKETGICVGSTGRVLKSTDAGETWRRINIETSSPLQSVTAANSRLCDEDSCDFSADLILGEKGYYGTIPRYHWGKATVFAYGTIHNSKTATVSLVLPPGVETPPGTVTSWEFNTDFNVSTEILVMDTCRTCSNLDFSLIITDGECEYSDAETATVVSSFDPNDKIVYPVGEGADGVIQAWDTLLYQINFQNTGDYPAVDVVVHDTIDSDLDVSTIEFVTASHPCAVALDGRDLTLTFANINLPDSSANEPGSHGFVSFSIRPMAGIAEGTELTNRASIVFDENAPVATNTVRNTIYRSTIALGSIRGLVSVGGSGLSGIPIDLFNAAGEMVAMTYTDESGRYEFKDLSEGNYAVSLSTPLGYQAEMEVKEIEVAGSEYQVDFALIRLEVPIALRGLGYWMHQVNALLTGNGNHQESYQSMCEYMELIRTHFNEYSPNPVGVFEVGLGADCDARLENLQTAISPKMATTMNERAKTQLTVLLLNVVAGKIGQWQVISEDSLTISQAITFCNVLITDGDDANDEIAKDIAETINEGKMVAAGWIDPSTAAITYRGLSEVPIPTEYSLYQNSPNPFNPVTVINFALPNAGRVECDIYNIMGQKVVSLVDEYMEAGRHQVIWDGRDGAGTPVATGIYFYSLRAGEFVDTKKMILLK